MITFQDMIFQLTNYWANLGCTVHQGHDVEVGAGTFNPATFLRCLGPEPYKAVYVEPSRRPSDGRYGDNPNRLGFFHQMQVILKPSPSDIVELYLGSLEAIGLNLNEHDMRFVHDDWENPTIGAWGLGWEVWSDGMEVTQFTYFQAVGGLPVKPVSGELTYGLERLAMYIQGVDSIYDLQWSETLTYGDIFKRSEWEWSHYSFTEANTPMWLSHFDDYEAESKQLIEKHLPLPAYDFVMKASHAFNVLEARGHLSVTERARYISRIRSLASGVAECYVAAREKMSFPLLSPTDAKAPSTADSVEKQTIDPSKKEDFLLEIGCEELPATFVPIGMRGLENKMHKLLEKAGISFDSLTTYGTPRRLAVLIKGLSEGTTPQVKERKGPSVKAAFDDQNQPTGAGCGFFRSLGLEPKLDQKEIEVRDGYLFAKVTTPGISTRQLLAKSLAATILSIEFPKSMRWGDFTFTFARPIRWLTALYGKETILFTIGDVTSSNTSYGHRQLSSNSFEITHPNFYLAKLKEHYVLADVKERQAAIINALPKNVLEQERVLTQVVNLVEYPFVIEGHFDKSYLGAPKAVLMSEMIEHQKYFPIADENDLLAPRFIIVSNNKPSELIKHGHEKALSPRLSDGVFLYEEDLKTPFETFNDQLKRMTYQAPIGSQWAKVERIKAIATKLHTLLPLANLDDIHRAVHLCKSDLASLLVGEFPHLQGQLGKLYALKHGEKEEIATAIDEHWMPRSEKDTLPQGKIGIVICLADKLDNLISCFALGLKPTSSSDPYALRRQALAIFKLLIHHRLHLPLDHILQECMTIFLANPEIDPKVKSEVEKRFDEILAELTTFLLFRLHSVLGEFPFKKDEIAAILRKTLGSPYDLYLRLEALHTFRQEQDFSDLIEVDTRTKKILRSQKDWEHDSNVQKQLLTHPAEQELFRRLEELKGPFHQQMEERHYTKAFLLLTQLKDPLASLFDAVKVIDDNKQVRINRLALLQNVYDLCKELADLSKLSH